MITQTMNLKDLEMALTTLSESAVLSDKHRSAAQIALLLISSTRVAFDLGGSFNASDLHGLVAQTPETALEHRLV